MRTGRTPHCRCPRQARGSSPPGRQPRGTRPHGRGDRHRRTSTHPAHRRHAHTHTPHSDRSPNGQFALRVGVRPCAAHCRSSGRHGAAHVAAAQPRSQSLVHRRRAWSCPSVAQYRPASHLLQPPTVVGHRRRSVVALAKGRCVLATTHKLAAPLLLRTRTGHAAARRATGSQGVWRGYGDNPATVCCVAAGGAVASMSATTQHPGNGGVS